MISFLTVCLGYPAFLFHPSSQAKDTKIVRKEQSELVSLACKDVFRPVPGVSFRPSNCYSSIGKARGSPLQTLTDSLRQK